MARSLDVCRGRGSRRGLQKGVWWAEGRNETRLWPCRTLWDFLFSRCRYRTFKALEAVEAHATSQPRGHANIEIRVTFIHEVVEDCEKHQILHIFVLFIISKEMLQYGHTSAFDVTRSKLGTGFPQIWNSKNSFQPSIQDQYRICDLGQCFQGVEL